MIRPKSRVALAPAPQFTGTVKRDEAGLFTVEFDVGGRGWLRADDLIELIETTTERTPGMHVGSKVAFRSSPDLTATVKAVDNQAEMVDIAEDATGAHHQVPFEELIEVTDHELPDGKAWPPPGMETKSRT